MRKVEDPWSQYGSQLIKKMMLYGGVLLLILSLIPMILGFDYRRLHKSLMISDVDQIIFDRSFHRPTVLNKELFPLFIDRFNDFVLRGYLADRRSQCGIIIKLKNGRTIRYFLQLNPKDRKARISIQGSEKFSFTGISMGHFLESGSRFYNLVDNEQIYGARAHELRYCGAPN
jgi:hypothetical protein